MADSKFGLSQLARINIHLMGYNLILTRLDHTYMVSTLTFNLFSETQVHTRDGNQQNFI